jgi:hypothetical protein
MKPSFFSLLMLVTPVAGTLGQVLVTYTEGSSYWTWKTGFPAAAGPSSVRGNQHSAMSIPCWA